MEAQAVQVEKRFAPFGSAREAFDGLIGRLECAETQELSHADVERLIQKEGTEVLRRLLQGHIDLRGTGDVGPTVVGADEVERTRKRLKERRLLSIFGEVRVRRLLYSPQGGGAAGLAPLDASLNLPQELYSLALRRRIAEGAALSSFDDTIRFVAETTGAAVPKRQAEQLVTRAAADFDDFYAERPWDVGEESRELLVMTFDGKGIVMRYDGLREATQRAADKGRPALKTRLTKGEKRNRKRMAQVAAVYTIASDVRSPADVIASLWRDEVVRRKRAKPAQKRVWASLEKSPAAVIEQGFQEALVRDPSRSKRWVAVVDGNTTQLRLLRKAAKRHGVELTIVLDLIHVAEYLWGAARAFYDEKAPEGEEWVKVRLQRILEGDSSNVAGGMRGSATKRGLTDKLRKPVDKCANYLVKYGKYLRYDEYLADGLPIASGVVEGACRHLVKDRMDITGARWGLQGAEAVLKLRALRTSGDLDEYWTFHEDREKASNHDVLYAGGRAPDVGPRRPDGRPHLRLVK